jgi:hypothetical protein
MSNKSVTAKVYSLAAILLAGAKQRKQIKQNQAPIWIGRKRGHRPDVVLPLSSDEYARKLTGYYYDKAKKFPKSIIVRIAPKRWQVRKVLRGMKRREQQNAVHSI